VERLCKKTLRDEEPGLVMSWRREHRGLTTYISVSPLARASRRVQSSRLELW
jgi:hypothetical protein